MVLQNVVVNQFAKNGLRSIAFAYKDFTHEEWDEIKKDIHKIDESHLEYQKTFFSKLTLISIFAMEDQLRPDVVQAIKLAKKGSIEVCLVSGDQLETAVSFAI